MDDKRTQAAAPTDAAQQAPAADAAPPKRAFPTNNVICLNAVIKGKVTFGKGCIVHPFAQITADEGLEIVFGDYNIIEERVQISFKPKPNNQLPSKTMRIGSFNIFEAESKVTSSNIGDLNVFEPKSYVHFGSEIRNKCTIGAMVVIPSRTPIQDLTKLFYPDKIVREQYYDEESEKKKVLGLYEISALLIPKQNQTQK